MSPPPFLLAPISFLVIGECHASAIPTGELVGNSVDTLAQWRSQGIGPAYCRLNGTGPVRYEAASVRRWLRKTLITPGN